MAISQQINIINKAFVGGLKNILNKKLYGVYIYGAAAFPDKLPTGDIDFHVILKTGLTEKERLRLEKFHKYLARKFPTLGGELDGYYILLKDALKDIPPRSEMWKRTVDTSWALHCEHILAGRHIVLFGPKPKKIYRHTTWPEIKTALLSELDFVKTHLQHYPDYCILNLCRLLYSFKTKDVVISKDQASKWAYKILPQWRTLISLARKSYKKRATPEDKKAMSLQVNKFFEFTRKHIEANSSI